MVKRKIRGHVGSISCDIATCRPKMNVHYNFWREPPHGRLGNVHDKNHKMEVECTLLQVSDLDGSVSLWTNGRHPRRAHTRNQRSITPRNPQTKRPNIQTTKNPRPNHSQVLKLALSRNKSKPNSQSNPYQKLSSLSTRTFISMTSGDMWKKQRKQRHHIPLVSGQCQGQEIVEQLHLTRTARPMTNTTTTMTWKKNKHTLSRRTTTKLNLVAMDTITTPRRC